MKKKRKGLTLIELLLAVAIIAVINGACLLATDVYNKSIRYAKAKNNVNTLCEAHKMYYIKNGAFTTDANLVTGGYISAADMWSGGAMVDPFGNAFTQTSGPDTMTIQLSPATQAKLGTNITCTIP